MFSVARTVLKFGFRLFVNEKLESGDQWKESHAVIRTNNFDRICWFSPDSGVKLLFPRCTNQMHSPIWLQGSSIAHTPKDLNVAISYLCQNHAAFIMGLATRCGLLFPSNINLLECKRENFISRLKPLVGTYALMNLSTNISIIFVIYECNKNLQYEILHGVP